MPHNRWARANAALRQHLLYPSAPSQAASTEQNMGLDLVPAGRDVPNEINVVI